MSALGSLVVKLALEYAQFSQGLNSTEQEAKQHAKRVQDAYEEMADGVSERMGSLKGAVLGALGGAISVAGFMAAMNKVKQETMDAEQEQNQLAAAIKSTGASAGWSQERLNNMAASLAKNSNFSEGLINQAQTRLLSYTGIVGQQFPRALQAVADMSTRLSVDMTASAETIGKALDIPSEGLTALSKQGFRFTDAQKELVKQFERTGQVGEAQAIILQALESSYGGAAAAARDSFGGAMNAVSETINSLMTADSASLPGLRASVEGLNETLNSDSVKEGFQSMVASLVDIGSFAANSVAQIVSLGQTIGEHKGEIAVLVGALAGAGTAAGAMKVAAAIGGAGGIVGAIGKVRAAFLALTVVMAANPAGLAILGIGALTGMAVASNMGEPTGDRLSKEIEIQQERLTKAEALLARAGGPKGQLTARLESRIEGIRSHLETLRTAAGVATPQVAEAAAAVADVARAAEGTQVPLGKSEDWIKKYGTTAEKAALEVDEWKRKLGSAFTPEMQAQIEATYAKQDASARAGAQSAKQLQTAYSSLLDTIKTKIAEQRLELEGGKKLSDSDKLRVKYLEDLQGSLKGLGATERANIETRIAGLKTVEEELEAQREFVRLAEQERAQRLAIAAAAEQTVAGLLVSNQALIEEIELIGLSTDQQAAVLRLRRQAVLLTKEQTLAEMERASAITGTMTREQIALQGEIEALRERNDLLSFKADREVVAEAMSSTEEGWKSTAGTINQSLSDALMRGFEKGKRFAKSFGDSVVSMFKTMVLQPTVQGVVSGASGLAANAASAAGMNGVAKGLNAAHSANSMYGLATGYSSGMNAAASLFGAGSAAGASAASLGYANAISAIGGDGLGALIAANGSWGGVAAGTAASTAAGGAVTGTATAGGAGLTSTLAAIPGWGWAAMAAVAVASIFGGRGKKEITGTGIAGTLGAGGVNVRQYADWEQDGGWFHSDRTGRSLSGISEEMHAMLRKATDGITQSTRGYAAALGLSADAVNSYTHTIEVSLKDLSPEEQQEAIGAALAGYADGMAGVYDGLTDLVREGESASATLARLSVSLTSANAWLSMLRQRTFQLGLAGGDAASKLADAMGGLENLGAAVQQYYEDYYTEAEKIAYSTEQMTTALARVGIAMPSTKDAFRAVADSLDLNTESGRAAYAVLLTIAPTFAATVDQTAQLAAQLAQDTAAKLLETFSGRQQLIPLLDTTLGRFNALGQGVGTAAGSVLDMGNAAGVINTQLGVASSGLLFFGSKVQGVSSDMTAAQVESARLSDQILNLQLNASRTVTDIVGLSAALRNVNTETFIVTMQGVLTRLASMFSDVLGSISDERVAVRQAATQIINPTVMSKAAIEREIAGANLGIPSNAGLVAANQRLAAADAKMAGFADLDAKEAAYGAKFDAAYRATGASEQNREMYKNSVSPNLVGLSVLSGGAFVPGNTVYLPSATNVAAGKYEGAGGDKAVMNVANPGAMTPAQLAAISDAVSYVTQVLTPLRDSLGSVTNAQAEQSAAANAAKQATLAYVDSLQNYAIDASKATARLGRLREETVKYYESQKALADLMTQSAGTLRKTVADYRYNQLSPEEQFRSLEREFNTAYSMALSTSGETLAGYADEMSSLLGPMLDKMAEAGYGSNAASIATYLARAESVAGRVEGQVPVNYAADSLNMLGQIDSTLAALEAGSKSAERIISEAINEGRDQTVNGLRQVVNALTGGRVAAFAAGGMHVGGVRLVGENGPELEVTGPARIYSASQTRAMLAGGGSNADVVAELRALRQDNANMRAELRAIAQHGSKAARTLTQIEERGVVVRTDQDSPLATVPV